MKNFFKIVCMLSSLLCTRSYPSDINSELIRIVMQGNHTQLSAFFNVSHDGLDCNVPNLDNKTLLMRFLNEECSLWSPGQRIEPFLIVINLLIDHGADLKAIDCDGKTPLMYAVRTGKIKFVETLLKRGACIHDVCTFEGKNVLMHALECKDARDRFDVVQLLLDQGADIHFCCTQENSSSFGCTVLLRAAYIADVHLVHLLLKHNPQDIDVRGASTLEAVIAYHQSLGETRIEPGSRLGNIVELLLLHGFRCPKTVPMAFPPLVLAALTDNAEEVRMLLPNAHPTPAQVQIKQQQFAQVGKPREINFVPAGLPWALAYAMSNRNRSVVDILLDYIGPEEPLSHIASDITPASIMQNIYNGRRLHKPDQELYQEVLGQIISAIIKTRLVAVKKFAHGPASQEAPALMRAVACRIIELFIRRRYTGQFAAKLEAAFIQGYHLSSDHTLERRIFAPEKLKDLTRGRRSSWATFFESDQEFEDRKKTALQQAIEWHNDDWVRALVRVITVDEKTIRRARYIAQRADLLSTTQAEQIATFLEQEFTKQNSFELIEVADLPNTSDA